MRLSKVMLQLPPDLLARKFFTKDGAWYLRQESPVPLDSRLLGAKGLKIS